MTQVVTCLTRDFVAVAADRRLTELRTGKLVDDEAQKLVVIGTQVAVAYTGLANVKPPPRGETDLWLLTKLEPLPDLLPDILKRVEAAATETFKWITHLGPQAKRHAFVFAGWQDDGRDGWQPFAATCSNALDQRGRWEDYARPRFDTRVSVFRDDGIDLGAFGQPWSESTRDWLQRSILERGRIAPAEALALVAAAIRRTARTNPAVGRGLQAVLLPRDTVAGAGEFQMGALEGPDTGADEVLVPPVSGPTAMYLPPESNRGEIHWPHYIGRDAIRTLTYYPRVLGPEDVKRLYEEEKRRRDTAG
jgi:hypothetical protein